MSSKGNVGIKPTFQSPGSDAKAAAAPATAPEPDPMTDPLASLSWYAAQEAAISAERLATYCRAIAGEIRRSDPRKVGYRTASALKLELEILSHRAEALARILDSGVIAPDLPK